MAKLQTKTIFRQLLSLALAIVPSVAMAQSAAELKQIFAQAETYYLYGEYELANQLYILLDTTSNRNLQYKIGVCYLNIPGEKEKSVPYLEAAVKNASYDAKENKFSEKKAPLDSYFYLAKAYMINNELEKGMNTFQTFARLAGDSKIKGGMQNLGFVKQQIEACNNAVSFRQNPRNFSKKLLGQDFSQGSINENPAVSFDGNTMVFTEQRGMVNAIWFSKKIRGVWQTPVEITAELNAGEDCSSCSLNNDGTELFLYKTDDYDGAIYSSKYVNDTWAPITKLNKNINTKFYESHAAVSANGKRLFFTSNREGGTGGLDIYVSEKDNLGEWGPAKNLGPGINTEYNEDTPFISSNDSLLFFCSEGHQSMGGYDNYVSAIKDSTWTAPANLGFPLNTTDDDRFFQPLNNGENGYYSIATDYKKKDIFYIGFGDISFELKGTVTLSDTTLIFDENYLVYLTDAATGDTLGKKSPEPYSGKYDFKIKPGNYRLKYTGTGYFSSETDTAVTADFPLAELFVDVTLMRDSSAARPKPRIVYEKINLADIPVISEVDTSMLVRDRNVRDVTENDNEDILYYTVQVIALHNPVNVSYFKHIDDLKIIYNENDKFYRYTTGEFPTRDDAYKWRLDLISKGYPTDIFIKKVTKQQNNNPQP
ncbi:MAG TPA: hypothetical protein VK207_10615 [Bacteroidales bacterium]|nr:hypothetical protein [Bacteroidales bacterium]